VEQAAGEVDDDPARRALLDGLLNHPVHLQRDLVHGTAHASEVSAVLAVDAAELVQHAAEPVVEEDVLALRAGDPEREALEEAPEVARQEQLLISAPCRLGVHDVEGQANRGQVQQALPPV